jgi:hypothetical protein
MAGKRAGKWARIFVDGYDLAVKISDIGPLALTYDEIEVSGYTQDKNYLAGQGDSPLTFQGYLDDTDNSTHEAFSTMASGDNPQVVTVALGNNAAPAIGDPTASIRANQLDYTSTTTRSGAIVFSAALKPGPDLPVLEWGVLLLDATVTADGSGTSVNNGGATTAGGSAYLHITGLSAGDTIAVTIEDSANNSTWATIGTFTLDGSALGGERIAIAGTIRQYTRATYDVTGAGVSFPLAVALHRN